MADDDAPQNPSVNPDDETVQSADDPVIKEDIQVIAATDAGPVKKKRFWQKIIPEKLVFLMKSHKRVSALIGLLIIGAAGFIAFTLNKPGNGEQPVTHLNAVEIPFKVVGTFPERDALNANVHTSIKVSFNRPVDPIKFRENFFITPHIEGTFSAGDNDKVVIFEPEADIAQGTSVQFGISGTLESRDGQKLGANFASNYTTSVPSQGVLFERRGLMTKLDPLAAGEKAKYSLMVGNEVKQATITTYKSDVNRLLDSLTYKQVTDNGYTYSQPLNGSINTAGLTSLGSKENIKNSDTYEFSGENGVFLLVATEQDKQLGHVWVVVSDFGVMLRQDDQKVVMSVQNFSSYSDATAEVTLYNLEGSVRQLAKNNVTGISTVKLGATPKLDIAVAKSQSGYAVVPVSITDSLADARLTHDLSRASAIYGTTDKPTYRPGEKVNFAGFARKDNDANYALPNKSTHNLYVARYDGEEPKAEFSATAGTGGVISGSFTTSANYIGEGIQKDTYQIFERSEDKEGFDRAVASFTITNEAQPKYGIEVKFDKSDYMPTDKITANIKAANTDGSPLANTSLSIKVYAKNYYEGEASDSNIDPGLDLKELENSVKLNDQGIGSYTVDVSKLPAGNSQTVTVQAGTKEAENQEVAGAGSAIIHQGNAKLEFGTSKTSLPVNGKLVARVYAKKLDNAPHANAKLHYALKTNYYDENTKAYETKQIAEGTGKTDGNGYAELTQELSGANQKGSLELVVWTSDEANNKVSGSNYYYVSTSEDPWYNTDLQFAALDVYGSEKNVKAGDKIKLTIDAASDIRAFVTLERGRIHKIENLDLKKGKNTYEIDVSSELSPSFTIAISYFKDGKYVSEGTMFNVAVKDKHGTVDIKPASQNLTANTPFNLQITTKDAKGNNQAGSLILGIADENMYRLVDPTANGIFTALYSPRSRTTNASSSLTGLGSGGGRCGGHGGGWLDFVTPSGNAALWRPNIRTDATGISTQNVSLPKGVWRVYVYSMSDDTIVSNSSIILNVN